MQVLDPDLAEFGEGDDGGGLWCGGGERKGWGEDGGAGDEGDDGAVRVAGWERFGWSCWRGFHGAPVIHF